jgi:hypothetical protein
MAERLTIISEGVDDIPLVLAQLPVFSANNGPVHVRERGP